MIPIFRNAREVETIFDLFGRDENDLTGALGWCMAKVPSLTTALLHCALPQAATPRKIHLQRHDQDRGFTDIEIQGDGYLLIVEAKVGWTLPSLSQLQRYIARFSAGSTRRAFLILSDCSPSYAARHLPTEIEGVPIVFRSWEKMQQMCRKAASTSDNKQKELLRQLHGYLQRGSTMQDQNSNLVYVVALKNDTPEWSTISWIDIIEKKGRYFHPMEKRWPKIPPNYLGFRYHGQLQSIHHVESYELVRDMHQAIPEIDSAQWLARDVGEYVVYTLGAPIRPPHRVASGPIRNNRYSVALDLLLTSPSVIEAARKTKERQAVSADQEAVDDGEE
jgi:hypothetical protein